MDQMIENQKKYFQSGTTLSVDFRIGMLKKLYSTIQKYEDSGLNGSSVVSAGLAGQTVDQIAQGVASGMYNATEINGEIVITRNDNAVLSLFNNTGTSKTGTTSGSNSSTKKKDLTTPSWLM